jgi:hypothetical protein
MDYQAGYLIAEGILEAMFIPLGVLLLLMIARELLTD